MDECPPAAWTAMRFFELLPKLGRLRVINVCGPSVFEAICEAAPFDLQGGSINLITPDYHWHFAHARFGFLQSHDTVHQRSGRRVLFFTLHENQGDAPFLRIYVYRAPNEEFDPAVVDVFQAVHAELGAGVRVEASA